MRWFDLQDLIQSVADGVMFGANAALIGIGFTLIFGVMHKINLSHATASIGAACLSRPAARRPGCLPDEPTLHAASRRRRLHSPLPPDPAERNRHAHP